MSTSRIRVIAHSCLLLVLAAGCQSPYYADRGAAAGGLLGAGTGALIGSQTGNAGGGAIIGAGLGALAGNVFGAQLDEVAAQNRAAIAPQLGRQVTPGAATVQEVVAMHQAGVDPQLMTNYVTSSGVAQPISVDDVIYLHQQGVPAPVIQAMQTPTAPTTMVAAPPGPVIVEEVYPYGPPVYCEPRVCSPRVGFGISIRN
ncbi:glycine zipper domain-containing protein [Aeoliella sp. ICT_H6.2]|uniref:Glycine zipper domain-containing protein n=1 Tax=Aeoliella straminimaris TaxID=2954799 RepID=A0A9X2FFQ0_9BACT|nr:glycine zipper domain-containing protein [Aeoliella straminimaris]MCO6044886.1 glycine zipper domain-containing protein [Aeoliella straminimaris]